MDKDHDKKEGAAAISIDAAPSLYMRRMLFLQGLLDSMFFVAKFFNDS